jgi:rare lipoprotein A
MPSEAAMEPHSRQVDRPASARPATAPVAAASPAPAKVEPKVEPPAAAVAAKPEPAAVAAPAVSAPVAEPAKPVEVPKAESPVATAPALPAESAPKESASAPLTASLPVGDYEKSGQATWYRSTSKNLIKTASGEKLDNKALTAAHRTLPFNTMVKVTDPKTKKSVTVRINDRGPFGDKKYIIDVSEAAAKQLGLNVRGFMPVEIEVVAK